MIFVVVRTLGFLIVRQVLGLVGLGPAPDAKDLEIAVLRHRLVVLRRQVARPRYTPTDRTVLATLARLLPRERWALFLVNPATLLRSHRELVRRRWTYSKAGRRGRRSVPEHVVELVVRLAGRAAAGGICGSSESAASSASPSPRPPSGRSCAPTDSARRRVPAGRAGPSARQARQAWR